EQAWFSGHEQGANCSQHVWDMQVDNVRILRAPKAALKIFQAQRLRRDHFRYWGSDNFNAVDGFLAVRGGLLETDDRNSMAGGNRPLCQASSYAFNPAGIREIVLTKVDDAGHDAVWL